MSMGDSGIITRNEKDPLCEDPPLFAVILYRKALEQMNKGDYESALHHLGQVVKIAPGFIMALCEMGLCYEALGQYPEALSQFDKALQIDPSVDEAEIGRRRIQYKVLREKYAP